MGKVINYSVHLKPIKLANLPVTAKTNAAIPHEAEISVLEVAEFNPIRIAASSDNTVAIEPNVMADPISLADLHQKFLLEQAQIQIHFFELQNQMLQLILTKEDSSYVSELTESVIAVEQVTDLPGPKFSRTDLEVLASGKISSIFGDWFKPLDQYERLIRMPEPPLLLADRVTGIAAEPGSFGTGTMWTETDVLPNAWYLHHNRMPAAIMVEAGQADLLLISWLGLDFFNQGERVYRLLGSEVTFYGGLAKPGETLCYEIHVDGHAKHGDVRLFFFHYDCRVNGELRMQVRQGQAGFFSYQELANSGGVLWQPEEAKIDTSLPLDPPYVVCQYNQFSQEQLRAFSHGDAFTCFGPGFELTQSHTRTPTISSESMLFINEITHFSVQGGPLKRGYMRAIQNITKDDWFFKGHFKNDPCMPGTLMMETGLQVMRCYLTALGFTIHRDGWQFETAQNEAYKIVCRGQVIPSSKQVTYEIFVCSIIADPIPKMTADLLATVDGLKAFHTRVSLCLVPDWPLSENELALHAITQKPAIEVNGFKFDYASLLACALGKPSLAFGPFYKAFDNHRRIPRLPGPPYHFISRIVDIQGDIGCFQSGVRMVCEYDIPPDAWYFAKNSAPLMPYSVFLESALQPCGWLASYIGSTLVSSDDLVFRNLDGTGKLSALITPRAGIIRTHVECTNISQSAGMIIESFKVNSYIADKLIYSMDTVFGFFPKEAFENQVGIVPTDTELQQMTELSDFFADLTKQPDVYFKNSLRLAIPDLLMLDRITGFWPNGGKNGLGLMRAEKTVNPAEWFFKAHFFQDPVQPGSLGIEAMLQLLQCFMLESGMHKTINNPYFEPLALNNALTWKYRGQVIPTNKLIITTIEITAINQEQHNVSVNADAALWVDGVRIYTVKNLGMRISSGANGGVLTNAIQEIDYNFDPAVDHWLLDHLPNYVSPTLPMMSMADIIADSVSKLLPAKKCIALKDVQVLSWALTDKPITIKACVTLIEPTIANVVLKLTDAQATILAKGIVEFADHYPVPPLPPEPLLNLRLVANVYDSLFHGPAFQLVKKLMVGEACSLAEIDTKVAETTFGYMNQILLDASVHGIPHYDLSQWDANISKTAIGYPMFIPLLQWFGEPPRQGIAKCQAKFLGFHHSKYFPKYEIVLLIDNVVRLKYELVDVLFSRPKSLLQPPANLVKYLRNKQYVAEMSLAKLDEKNRLFVSLEDIKQMNWIPGAVEILYQVSGNLVQIAEQILMKEYIAHQEKIHPSRVTVVDQYQAFADNNSKNIYVFELQQVGDIFTVISVIKSTV